MWVELWRLFQNVSNTHCLGSNELKILHLSHRTRKTFLTLTFVMASRLDFLERWMARQKSTNSNGIQFARVKDVALQDWCVYIAPKNIYEYLYIYISIYIYL